MSIDRTKSVYDIIKIFLIPTEQESITFDSIEEESIYSVTAAVKSFERATSVCAAITQHLVLNGFIISNIDMAKVKDKVFMNFRVNVGSIKSL